MIAEEQLQKLDYRKWGPTAWFPFCDFFYQRRVTDEQGIRYFIDVKHYPTEIYHGVKVGGAWEVEMNINEPPVRFAITHPESINEFESLCHKFWEMMGKPYYELYQK